MKAKANKKVLIVDDSPAMRTILRTIIGGTYDVVEADTRKQGLWLFKKENPDLVLLDIVLSGGDEEGIRILNEIRKADANAAVVIISAVGQDSTISACKKLGAKDYIVKPFDEDYVLAVVKKHIG